MRDAPSSSAAKIALLQAGVTLRILRDTGARIAADEKLPSVGQRPPL